MLELAKRHIAAMSSALRKFLFTSVSFRKFDFEGFSEVLLVSLTKYKASDIFRKPEF
jgi:hypothetical protein